MENVKGVNLPGLKSDPRADEEREIEMDSSEATKFS